jgi:hypothetical protein
MAWERPHHGPHAGRTVKGILKPTEQTGDYIRDKPMSTSYLASDRPESWARRYLARFFGFFFAALPRGFGGVLSILRSTSSGLGVGLDFSSVMAGV